MQNNNGHIAEILSGATFVCGDRYMITKSIGKGSFGEIFQGIDTQTKKEVAIKMVEIFQHVKLCIGA
jgi:hypothetical protein